MNMTGMNEVFQCAVTGIVLAVGTYTDLRFRSIRKRLIGGYFLTVLAGHLTAVILSIFVTKEGMGAETLIADILAGMLPGAGCIFLSFITRQSLGYGDSLLILICGISLGLNGCLSILLTALFGAGIWALLQILVRRANRRNTLPFVPFLLLGLLVYFRQLWSAAGR